VRQDAGHVGHQHGQAGHEHRHPLHVEAGQPLEAGQREAQPEQRHADGAEAEPVPESRPEGVPYRPGERPGEQGQRGEEAEDQGGDGAEPAAGVFGHEAATVTRRSWNCASTG
jgi:hypothetical protein